MYVCNIVLTVILILHILYASIEKWDGCAYDPKIQGLFGPNVDGLGYVDQVLE